MSRTELIGIRLCIGMKNNRRCYLRNLATGELNNDAEKLKIPEEHFISQLIPCLNPNLKAADYSDTHLMKTRYIEDAECTRMETEMVTNAELGRFYPNCYEFFPSDDVMMKLIQRMTQVKKKAEIWKGFKIILRDDETETYHPDDLLYFFEEDEINN